MHRRTGLLGFFVVLVAFAGVAAGHFHTYWPDSPNAYAALGREVVYEYFWGHPYEMVLFDAEEPDVYVVAPGGDRVGLSPRPVQVEDPDTGAMRRSFAFAYTPEAIGDHWVVVAAPPYAVEEEGEAVQDYVKQCLHVMAETGWQANLGLPIELVPLTRPYGLEAGFVLKARAFLDGEPLPGAAVEIEKFNGFHLAEERLPRDQFGMEDVPMITRAAMTDVNGYVVCTLDEPGWWVVSVAAQSGAVTVGGTEYPRVLRGCLWVHVREESTVAP